MSEIIYHLASQLAGCKDRKGVQIFAEAVSSFASDS